MGLLLESRRMRTDGTIAGTFATQIAVEYGKHELANVNSTLFCYSRRSARAELWRSDGTPAGTQLVRDINPGPADSQPDYLTNVK